MSSSEPFDENQAYLWVEHVGDALNGSVQHQASHQEDEEHHVGEDGREVHDLENHRQTDRQTEPVSGGTFWRRRQLQRTLVTIITDL